MLYTGGLVWSVLYTANARSGLVWFVFYTHSFFQPDNSNVPDSNDSDSDMELTTGTSSSGGEASRSKRCRFMHHWLKLYPWIIIEGSGESLVVYCRDCKQAKLSNDFARGKKQPPKGWLAQKYKSSLKKI